MAETLPEEITKQKDAVRDLPKARLERFLQENNIKVFTEKDFDFPKDKKTQAKIRAEVDEFLEMREQWRKEDLELEKDNKNGCRN